MLNKLKLKSKWLFGTVCIAMAVVLTLTAYANAGRKASVSFVEPDTNAIEAYSNRRTQPEPVSAPVKNRLNTDGFVKIAENATLELWLSEQLYSMRVVDKQSGYVWGSLSEEKPEGLNKKWTAMAHSICTFEYYDEQNNMQRLSLLDKTVKSDFKQNGRTLSCTVSAEKIGLQFTFTVELTEDSIDFSLKDDSIKENGSGRLKSVYFMPFFGCSREDEINGYIFIPDGQGALMRFKKASTYMSPFEKRVYGFDAALDKIETANNLMSNRPNDYLASLPEITFPVYGVVHGSGQNAFFAEIKNGEESAVILAYPAGMVTNYNWAAARFDYRVLYEKPVGREGAGITKIQENRNKINAEISFRFLSGGSANYSGMAVMYRDILKGRGVLGKERIDDNIPLRLDIVASEIKKSLIFNKNAELTTVAEAIKMSEALKESNIKNLTVSYKGWQKGGLNGSKLGELSVNKKVGSLAELEKLRDRIVGNGGRFYLSLNYSTANKDQIHTSTDAAGKLSRRIASVTDSNESAMYTETYYIKPEITADLLLKTKKRFSDFKLHLDNFGSLLYSDYTRNNEVTRAEAKKMFSESIGGNVAALNSDNAFLLKETEEYFDCPVTNSQYLFETDTVPFLSILLKGSIDLYAPYANQGFYSSSSVLKMIEYGLYPSFLVAGAQNSEIVDTPLEKYFSLNFDEWKTVIIDIYGRVNNALQGVEGKLISAHTVLKTGVSSVLYEDGTTLYINYNSVEEKIGQTVIPACGFVLKEVAQQ